MGTFRVLYIFLWISLHPDGLTTAESRDGHTWFPKFRKNVLLFLMLLNTGVSKVDIMIRPIVINLLISWPFTLQVKAAIIEIAVGNCLPCDPFSKTKGGKYPDDGNMKERLCLSITPLLFYHKLHQFRKPLSNTCFSESSTISMNK